MVSFFEFDGNSPTKEWRRLVGFLNDNGTRKEGLVEIIGFVISIRTPRPLKENEIKNYKSHIGNEYWERAKSIYTSKKDLRWKPSYLGRMAGSNFEFNQIEAIKRRLVMKPKSKVLTCVVQRPGDLKRASFMPAGIPCVTAIDFKFREKSLNMFVFFRSQDIVNFFLPDLHFLHSIQRDLVDHLASARRDIADAGVGNLVFILASGFAATSRMEKLRPRRVGRG